MASTSAMPSFFQKGYKPKPSKPKKDTKQTQATTSQWIEKYRPKTLADIMSQSEVTSILKNCVNAIHPENGNIELPNLLMYGPPGTGKTSSALALARELFGPELISERVLELNASDDRGINVVRTKMKDFSMRSVKMAGLKRDASVNFRPVAAIKLIILDECDSMTRPAQEALRRTMEKYANTTRFILIANYVSKIIGPIVSRCCKLRFKPLEMEAKVERLKKIAGEENVVLEQEAVDGLIDISGGDLRRCVNYLQSAVNVVEDDEIDLDSQDEEEMALDENQKPKTRYLKMSHVQGFGVNFEN